MTSYSACLLHARYSCTGAGAAVGRVEEQVPKPSPLNLQPSTPIPTPQTPRIHLSWPRPGLSRSSSSARRPFLLRCWHPSPAMEVAISEQLLRRNVKRFRGGLVFKAHGLVYHSTPGSRVIKKKKNGGRAPVKFSWPHASGSKRAESCVPHSFSAFKERIFIELMTSDRTLKASIEGSK